MSPRLRTLEDVSDEIYSEDARVTTGTVRHNDIPMMPNDSQIRILIVEDDLQIAQATQLILTSKGYFVKVANVAEYALELLEDQKFDLIILDIILPEMDGYELLTEMKQRHGISPKQVIMMSALQEEEHLNRAQQAGVPTYIPKPFSVQQFTEAIEKHLGQLRQSS